MLREAALAEVTKNNHSLTCATQFRSLREFRACGGAKAKVVVGRAKARQEHGQSAYHSSSKTKTAARSFGSQEEG